MLEESEIKEQLRLMLHRFYTKKLKEIPQNRGLEFQTRAFLLAKVRMKLEKLTQGELVPYESLSTL